MYSNSKVYLSDIDSLVVASQRREQIFIEYRDVVEEIFNSHEYDKESWEFTLKVLKKCAGLQTFSFFKLISV